MASQAVTRAIPRAVHKRFSNRTAYLFLSPALITIALLTVFPLIYTVIISFTNYNLYHSSADRPWSFVGFTNFIDLLSPDGIFVSLFFSVFAWTLIFALLTTVLNYLTGLILAIVLNNPRIRERAIYRTLLIVPYALPNSITVLVWQGLLNKSFGAIDTLLTTIGLPAVDWLNDTTGTQAALLMVNLWLSFPFQMIICLGGLQAIPRDVYEAASVDGATAWQRLRIITMPILFRITLPAAILAFTFQLTNFGIVYLLNKGNPPRADTPFAGTTDTLITFIYKLTLNFYRWDKAAALAIIVFAITVALSLIGFRVTGALKEIEA